MHSIKIWLTIVVWLIGASAIADHEVKTPTLSSLLKVVYEKNPMLASAKHQWRSEDSLVAAEYTLEDPQLGIRTLDRGTSTQYGVISQKMKFPVKYYLKGKAQSSRAKYQETQFDLMKMKIRQKVISLYFSIYATQKIIQLTKANMSTVKEFSRVAERKYAAGKSPQSDQMKAHFELTNLELDLINLKQEEKALQDELKAVLHDPNYNEIDLSSLELPTPEFHKNKAVPEAVSDLSKNLMKHSPTLKSQMNLVEEAEWKKSLAKWEYAPDIEFNYQERISGDPTDSRIFSVNFTFPLWFWKKGAEASAASAAYSARSSFMHHTHHMLMSKIKDLGGKVETSLKTLKIYKTTLIPQAQGAFNSSKGAYRASRVSFLELLDSERSLYRVKSGYFKSLKLYVQHLAQLETELGYSVSNLEKGVISGTGK